MKFTSYPTGGQKSRFGLAGEEVYREAKALTCMQTANAAAQVIFTHGRKIWRVEKAEV